MLQHATPLTSMILAAGLVVALGALVQGAVGYGMALVAAPLLALFAPALVPVPLILLTTVHAVLAVARDGRHTDWPGVAIAALAAASAVLLIGRASLSS